MPRQLFASLMVLALLGVFPGESPLAEEPFAFSPYPACGFRVHLGEGVRLYTPERPGPFQFSEKTLGILMKGRNPDLLLIHRSEIGSEAELERYGKLLHSQGLPQQGYRKLTLGFTALGNDGGKRALDHTFELQGPVARILRQIYFVHRGQGFALVAVCPSERFAEANQTFFEPLLRSLIFE